MGKIFMNQGEIWLINLDPSVSITRIISRTGVAAQEIVMRVQEATGKVIASA
jgi:dephospho-CoA kinase